MICLKLIQVEFQVSVSLKVAKHDSDFKPTRQPRQTKRNKGCVLAARACVTLNINITAA